jgi:hypothetical protein
MMFLPVLLPADKDCGVLPSGMAIGAELEFPEGPQSAPGEQPQEKLLELVEPPKVCVANVAEKDAVSDKEGISAR